LIRKPFFPFGINGIFAGASTIFFAYAGFETVATCTEEVKNPKRDLPLGILLSLGKNLMNKIIFIKDSNFLKDFPFYYIWVLQQVKT
jgi:amino acid transporter